MSRVNRKLSLANERELLAIDKEIDGLKVQQGEIEESLIEQMDDLESKENKEKETSVELEEKRKNVANDIDKLTNDIVDCKSTIDENKTKFDELAESLDAKVKTRFVKLTQSKKDGKGIGPLNGTVCGVCNFEIPSSLVQEVAVENAIKTCSNCGRYLYLN